MMQFIRFFNFLFLFFISVAPCFAETIDKIVARVNDSIITESDVTKARQKKPTLPREEIIQNLIDGKIIDEQIEKKGGVISATDVTQALANMAKHENTTIDELRIKITNRGISFEDYKEDVKKDLQKQNFLKQAIYPRISISDYDIDKYYTRHPNDFQGFGQMRYMEIYLAPDSIPAGANLEDFAKKLVRDLKKGSSFTEMAKKYSRGAFADKNGDSGLLNTKDMRPDLVDLLASLPLKTISDPLPVGGGIFIFKVLEKSNPFPKPVSQVKNQIREILATESVNEELQKFIMEMKSKSFIEIK